MFSHQCATPPKLQPSQVQKYMHQGSSRLSTPCLVLCLVVYETSLGFHASSPSSTLASCLIPEYSPVIRGILFYSLATARNSRNNSKPTRHLRKARGRDATSPASTHPPHPDTNFDYTPSIRTCERAQHCILASERIIYTYNHNALHRYPRIHPFVLHGIVSVVTRMGAHR
jgi:hypothetical protein